MRQYTLLVTQPRDYRGSLLGSPFPSQTQVNQHNFYRFHIREQIADGVPVPLQRVAKIFQAHHSPVNLPPSVRPIPCQTNNITPQPPVASRM